MFQEFMHKKVTAYFQTPTARPTASGYIEAIEAGLIKFRGTDGELELVPVCNVDRIVLVDSKTRKVPVL